ncbi:MAG: hypothetical protein COA73_17565 [Candidatus Hydrogenedentota bacterium]|nr:MAG: hypothetical protein COA73_17565 [Candidatus Hydrogenedentota bacterium]
MIEHELITSGQLKEALDKQKKSGEKIVEALIDLGHLTVEQFVRFLSGQPGVASIELSNYQIPDDVIALIPNDTAIENEIFPIDKMGKLLTLGMVCPLDAKTIEEIESMTGLRVKPILCSPTDIKNAISQYYPKNAAPKDESSPEPEVTPEKVETGLKMSKVLKLISGMKTLPALPETVEKVKEAMDDLSVSPNEVAAHIIMDPPIAAKVLSVANSAAYGFPNRVDTVELAVALLGLRETYSIVLSAAVMNLFETSQLFDYKRYWEEAMNCASAAKIIAKACGKGEDKGIFTAGLLHDIGRIALLETDSEEYSKINFNLIDDDLIQAEQEFMGVTHTEAGFELATNWNLPSEISEAIRYHHNPEFSEQNKVTVAIVALSEKWTRSKVLGNQNKDSLLEQSEPLLKTIQMNADTASVTFDLVAGLEPVFFEWNGESAA